MFSRKLPTKMTRFRGFDPYQVPMKFKDHFVEDAPKSGRPSKATDDAKQAVITKVSLPSGRYMTAADLACHLPRSIRTGRRKIGRR